MINLRQLFRRTPTPRPHYASGLLAGFVVAFAIVCQTKPVVGLAGLGTVAIVAAALVELNRVRIWEDYKKAYKKQRGKKSGLRAPNRLYYTINVALLWPAILLLGVLCLYLAYTLA